MGAPQRRRPPRRKGRANSDAERRALAKAHVRPLRPVDDAPPGFAVLHCDGGARGVPGPAATAYVIDDAEGTRIHACAEAIGPATAAVAEYRAVLAGLEAARDLGLSRVAVRCDSRLLVDHLRGERHARNPRLVALGADILEAATRIGTVRFDWIAAESNAVAHALVAGVLDPPSRARDAPVPPGDRRHSTSS
jgi:ribonuclease HI